MTFTNGDNYFPKFFKPGKCLLAPLDWGLGHTTRCIPLVKQLLHAGTEVVLAGNETQKAILNREFPDCEYLYLPGYEVRYATNSRFLRWQLLSQSLRLMKKIRDENEWLKSIQRQHNFDTVISDNRYGLYHPAIHSVIITHQLHIDSGWKFLNPLIRKTNYRLLNKFNACWIPDHESAPGLAGRLSHPSIPPPIPIHYLGPLSRFNRAEPGNQVKNRILIIISGPEPQRQIFESLLLEQVKRIKKDVVIVRGLPAELSQPLPSLPAHINIFDHLDSGQLQQQITEAEFVISRSGYSTVMDLAACGKRSILIPTPNQPEQEYLAHHLSHHQYALCISQQQFDLTRNLEEAASFNYRPFPQRLQSLSLT